MQVPGCLLGWAAIAALGCWSPTVLAATAPVQISKVVRQYALTSANDFPQRDPRDWRLLGSNDGGRTWVTLDLRRGEIFLERHQRRVFAITNQIPFKLYRLQIDRVRDPSGADSVQLAEIEALGDTEDDLDPTPTEADIITAQGAKVPMESAYNAFDGQIETKWLDFATQNPATRSSWIQWQYADPGNLQVTNVQQLLKLRSRARQAYPVRIEGVVAGRLQATNGVWFLDATGNLELPGPEAAQQLHPGQRVLLEGTSQWTNRQVGVSHTHLQPRGPTAPMEPRLTPLEATLELGEDLQWVELEGQVGFVGREDEHPVFELGQGERSVLVHVLESVPTGSEPMPVGRVCVRGLGEAVLDSDGNRVLGILWVSSLGEIVPSVSVTFPTNSITGAGASLTNTQAPPVLTEIGRIRRLSPEQLVAGPRVKVRGVSLFGDYLQQGAECIETWRGEDATQLGQHFGGDFLEAEGRAVWVPGHGPVIKADSIQVLGKGKLPQPNRPSWSQLASGNVINEWIEVEGVVRATDGSHLLLSCQGGQLMATIRTASARLVEQLVDAAVRVRGVGVTATDDRGRVQGIQVLVPSLEFVEVKQESRDPFSLPVQPIGSLLQVKSPQDLVHRVKVNGVLTGVEGRKYFLQDDTGSTMAVAKADLILLVQRSGLFHWVFWQSLDSEAEPATPPPFNVGDKLEVVGFPEMGGQAPVITEALIHKVGHADQVLAKEANPGDILLGRHDSTLVSLEGRLLARESVGRDLVLEVQSGEKVFQAILHAAGRALPRLAAGSRIRVTGICQIEPSPYAELGKRVNAFKLLLRSPADVTVLERAPWWNWQHTLMVAGALALALAAAAAWIRILRRQVEERTKRLQHEIEEHRKTEAQLAEETRRVHSEIEEHKLTEQTLAEKTDQLVGEVEERKRVQADFERVHRQLLVSSRLAGMAEVATSVLHNVGNVLNGANLLASSIEKQVHQSQTPGVSRLADLLSDHQTDLSQFLAEDERGLQVCGHLRRLGTQLTAEQSRLVEKSRLLSESIQHIKEIVAMQQNNARIYGVTETVALSEIVEDALQMCSGASGWSGLELVRDYAPVPPAALDRHRVLQILFNLLENARQACEARGTTGGRITMALRLVGQDRVQAQVSDNGIGIPPENLSRVFTQGFSTRKGGHGFGLHSSILAAQDMGGSLSVHSDGSGLGATFNLELPLHQLESPPDSENRIPAAGGQQ
jgi:signal transduction histidine kinase